MTTEEAIRQLMNDPVQCARCAQTYVTRSAFEDAEAFSESGEFLETLRLIGTPLTGKTVVDLGAGRGIASHGFVKAGASRVYAVEPDPSDLVGYGAIKQLPTAEKIEIIVGFGESISLETNCADILYVRQVLHHAHNLDALVAECFRLLKPGGLFIACREHVANDAQALAEFLKNHPVHQLAGGEYAFKLSEYVQAIESSGFIIQDVLGPWDSAICAFPAVRDNHELDAYLRKALKAKLGVLGAVASWFPLARRLAAKWMNRRAQPGAMYSFVAQKPVRA